MKHPTPSNEPCWQSWEKRRLHSFPAPANARSDRPITPPFPCELTADSTWLGLRTNPEPEALTSVSKQKRMEFFVLSSSWWNGHWRRNTFDLLLMWFTFADTGHLASFDGMKEGDWCDPLSFGSWQKLRLKKNSVIFITRPSCWYQNLRSSVNRWPLRSYQ